MTDKLPANLLALFAPRPPLRYLPHCDHAPEKRRTAPITGVAAFLEELRKPDPDYVPTESWLQRRDRLREEKKASQEERVKAGLENYDPAKDPQIRGDPYKTLFVARLNYDVKEVDLEREFGRFGPIERIRIVRDKDSQKNRGYAFIVYEREKDMKAAYKETDGIRIKERRVLVDVERGRTVKGWKPRRLGGGLGGRGYTKIPVARPTGPSASGTGPSTDRMQSYGSRGGGGFRGGYSGSFRGGRGGFSGGNRYEMGAGRGPRGGIGYQGGGGFDRGHGGQQNGLHGGGGEAPPNAPTGPGGRRGGGGFGGYQGGANGYQGGSSGPGGYDRGYRGSYDRDGGRDGGRGDRFGDGGRDRDGGRDGGRYGHRDEGGRGGHEGGRGHEDSGYGSRKRTHDSDGGYGGGGDRHRRRY